MKTPSASDRERFVQLWYRLKIVGDVEAAWKRISEAYTERHRRYRTWDHILWCLSQFDLVKRDLDNPDLVEFAIYWHDVVGQPGEPDNVERSADVTLQYLYSAPMELRYGVKMLILDTKRKFEPVTVDGKYLVDIDISSMGDAEQNVRYVATVREEYLQFVTAEEYERWRRELIGNFLMKNRIYYTDFFFEKYETAARANLAKQLGE